MEEALKAYDKSLEIDPHNAETWYSEARAYARMGNKEEALDKLSKAIELNSDYKEKAKEDESFKEYWYDNDFRSLVEN